VGLCQRYCLYRKTNDQSRHEKPHLRSVQEYYSSCTPQCQTSIPPSSQALYLTKRTCLQTFNKVCVLTLLEHSPVLPSLITKFFLHWLDRLFLILPSLDRLLFLPLLVGSSSDLAFSGCIFF